MAWHRLATVVIGICLTTSCGYRDDTNDIYIEDRWTADEEIRLRAAMDEWNQLSVERMRNHKPVFRYAGRLNGRFRLDAFDDDVHVIYRISSPAEIPESLANPYYGGHGTKEDVVLIPARLGEKLR